MKEDLNIDGTIIPISALELVPGVCSHKATVSVIQDGPSIKMYKEYNRRGNQNDEKDDDSSI